MLIRAVRKNKWVWAGLVIAATVTAMSLLNLDNYTVYFYTPKEAVPQAGKLQGQVIRVGGMVKGGSVNWQPESLALSFVVSDLQDYDIEVSYKGSPPDMFKENQGVVVEGRLAPDGKSFLAHNLMVKHSEEYRAPDSHHSVDKQLLEKSIFKP